MDPEFKITYEQLYDLFIKISVGLRGGVSFSDQDISNLKKLLKEIKCYEDSVMVERKLLKYIIYIYTDILSEFSYIAGEKKLKLINFLVQYEEVISNYLKSDNSIGIQFNETHILDKYIKTLDVDSSLLSLLDQIRNQVIHQSGIPREFAYDLFMLQKKLLWKSSFFTHERVDWNKLSNEDELFKNYWDTLDYIMDIFGKELKM